MTALKQTITVPFPRMTIKVKLPRAYGLRMWLTTVLLGIVGKVCPHDIEVEIEAASSNP